MKRYSFGLIGLAVLVASSLMGQTFVLGGESCRAEAGCSDCCSQCGCRLVPVCHISCTTKKVTEYKYVCKCEDLCVPGVTPICKKCRSCETSGECAAACDNGCEDGCCGHCKIHEVHKLAKYPVTKEVPVRKCTVEWVCPHCNCHGNCAAEAAPSAPVPTATPAPAPPTAGKSAAQSLPDESAGVAIVSRRRS